MRFSLAIPALLVASSVSACWAFVGRGVPIVSSSNNKAAPPVVAAHKRTRSTSRRPPSSSWSSAPSGERRTTATTVCFSTVADRTEGTKLEERDDDDDDDNNRPQLASPAVKLSEEEYLRRLEAQLEKLRQKDQLSPLLTKEVSAASDRKHAMLDWD